MRWFSRKAIFRVVRIIVAILFIVWGIVGVAIPPLFGGIWTILLGMTLMAYEIPWVKQLDDRLLAWCERRFPKLYCRVIMPARRIRDMLAEKIRSFLS